MSGFWVEVAAEAAGEMMPSGTGPEALRDRNVTLERRVAPGIECASCKRVFSRRRRLCIYCGTSRKDVSAFDAV